MKKFIYLFLAFGLMLFLTACQDTEITPELQDAFTEVDAVAAASPEPAENHDTGDNDTSHNEEHPVNPQDPEPTEFIFLLNSVPIHMDQDMEELLPQLGEPLGIFEAPSCAFDGIDRIFGFPGVDILTYPIGDRDLIHTINFRDDSVTTTKGIYLGSSWADVLEAYGSDYSQDVNMFQFTRGQTTLSFFLDGDMVIGIIYALIMD